MRTYIPSVMPSGYFYLSDETPLYPGTVAIFMDAFSTILPYHDSDHAAEEASRFGFSLVAVVALLSSGILMLDLAPLLPKP